MLGLFDQVKWDLVGVLEGHASRAISVWANGIKDMIDATTEENSSYANFSVSPDLVWGDHTDMNWKGGPLLFECVRVHGNGSDMMIVIIC